MLKSVLLFTNIGITSSAIENPDYQNYSLRETNIES